MTGDAAPDTPDFARLYTHPGSTISPRMASRLWAAAVTLADTYDEDRWHLLTRALPPIAQRLANEVWMERFACCFGALARRFEGREFDATGIATCTAEEMALHLVIDVAEGATRDGSLATDLSLPARPDRDEDFDAIRELHFRDHDVLLLFDASLDGIEAPNSAVDEYGRFANLHPQAWFLPFEDDGQRRRGHDARPRRCPLERAMRGPWRNRSHLGVPGRLCSVLEAMPFVATPSSVPCITLPRTIVGHTGGARTADPGAY